MRRRSLFAAVVLWVALFAAPLSGAVRQVDGLNVRHRQGQTFITWNEIDPPEVSADVTDIALRQIVLRANEGEKLQYRIYRSDRPIATVESLTPIARIGRLSCWNVDYHGIDGDGDSPAVRYVVREGDGPLPRGRAVYVHNPKCEGSDFGYYAVTVVEDGSENKAITKSNVTAEAVRERQGQGEPVLQRIVKPDEFAYIKGPELHYYVRWECPPNSSVENRAIDYLVAIPPEIVETPTPVGLHLHCWGGSLNGGYGWWYHYGKLGTTYLISSNQVPYDWWTGYHESYYGPERSKENFSQGVVRPYTTRRMLSFLDWATVKYDLDLNRVFTAGSSMGGSGAPMFAIRNSDRIAWSVGWVGVHDPGNTPQFTGSYERVYGDRDWEIRFEDGSKAFDYYKDAAYLRRYPGKDVGFITWSNGKDDGAIGWPQAVEFLAAMQQTRRPHIFVWGMSGHGQRATMPAGGGQRVMPIDIRLDQSLPAFTNCSLDDNPGTAARLSTAKEIEIDNHIRKDEFDGDSQGQINLYLNWSDADIVDTAERWEMTVGLTDDAPEEKCLADVTPRRLQRFKLRPGLTVKWAVAGEGQTVQSGKATVDQWSLVTLPGVVIGKKQCRITISR